MKLKISYSLIIVGVLLGIFGFVRSGALVLSIGSACVTYLRYSFSQKKRKIELVLPLALSLTLFVVALTLPHGK
jgi:hypothetical protein